MKKTNKYVALYTAMNEWAVPIEAECEEEAFDMAEDILNEMKEDGRTFDWSDEVDIDIYEVSGEDDSDFDDGLESIMALIHFIRDNDGISDRTLARMVLNGMEYVWDRNRWHCLNKQRIGISQFNLSGALRP